MTLQRDHFQLTQTENGVSGLNVLYLGPNILTLIPSFTILVTLVPFSVSNQYQSYIQPCRSDKDNSHVWQILFQATLRYHKYGFTLVVAVYPVVSLFSSAPLNVKYSNFFVTHKVHPYYISLHCYAKMKLWSFSMTCTQI